MRHQGTEGKMPVIKLTVKTITWLLLIFFIILVVVNIAEPIWHPELSGEQLEKIQNTEFVSDTLSTERIRCIDDNEEALLWRIRMIQAAEESIVLSTFDLRGDESGQDVMAALYDAADRGVEVRILVDGLYQILFLNGSDAYRTLCSHENVEAGVYNLPNLKNIWRGNYRMHDKYLIVDDKMYLLGGRNTNDIFLGSYPGGKNVDREILVYQGGTEEGESLQDLQEYFEEIWNSPYVEKAKTKKPKNIGEQQTFLKKRYQELCTGQDKLIGYDNWLEDTYAVNKITLLHNGIQAGKHEPVMLGYLEHIMADSKDVMLQTPYVICDEQMYEVLENTAQSAKVRIILNAVEQGTNPWGCSDYLNHKNDILDCGVTVYELMNEPAVHTKTIAVDDQISVIGSYNYDIRSTYLDTELMLVIDSRELNAHIRSMNQDYMGKSREVFPDGTETAGKFYEEKELSWIKQMTYGLLRVLTCPIRHLL